MKTIDKKYIRSTLEKEEYSFIKTLTDLRTYIRFRQYKNLHILRNIHLFENDLSWQKRHEWLLRIMNYDGPKTGDAYEYNVVKYGRDKADQIRKEKSDVISGFKNPAYKSKKYAGWGK